MRLRVPRGCVVRPVAIGAAVAALGAFAPMSGAMTIVLTADAGLSANAAALAAFQRAANTWDSIFSDPITVNISAGLDNTFTNARIIGATGSTTLTASYSTIVNQMKADALPYASNAIVQSLPTNLTATLPAANSLSGRLSVTKANAKALGFTGLDTAQFGGATDATITFNSQFAFDYDDSNGVSANTIDFQSVATHEIAHALGFDSIVDNIDTGTTGAISPYTLDLFRLTTPATTTAKFMAAARQLTPGATSYFSDTSVAYLMSTGTNTTAFPADDGNQASHWKDDALTGQYIGIMDPTIAYGVSESVTSADIRALDLIGYDYVPEPALLGTLAAVPLLLRRRQRAA